MLKRPASKLTPKTVLNTVGRFVNSCATPRGINHKLTSDHFIDQQATRYALTTASN